MEKLKLTIIEYAETYLKQLLANNPYNYYIDPRNRKTQKPTSNNTSKPTTKPHKDNEQQRQKEARINNTTTKSLVIRGFHVFHRDVLP